MQEITKQLTSHCRNQEAIAVQANDIIRNKVEDASEYISRSLEDFDASCSAFSEKTVAVTSKIQQFMCLQDEEEEKEEEDKENHPLVSNNEKSVEDLKKLITELQQKLKRLGN